jgi:hypothetical protein
MAKKTQQVEQIEIKSKVLERDRKWVKYYIGADNTYSSLQIHYILETAYEKTSKRASWDNFWKKWRPTVLKMEGSHLDELEKVILGTK